MKHGILSNQATFPKQLQRRPSESRELPIQCVLFAPQQGQPQQGQQVAPHCCEMCPWWQCCVLRQSTYNPIPWSAGSKAQNYAARHRRRAAAAAPICTSGESDCMCCFSGSSDCRADTASSASPCETSIGHHRQSRETRQGYMVLWRPLVLLRMGSGGFRSEQPPISIRREHSILHTSTREGYEPNALSATSCAARLR